MKIENKINFAKMKTAKNRQIARAWFEAFNQKNLQNLLNLYHNGAQHYSPKLKIANPETEGLIIGKEALKNWWQGAFTRLPSLNYQLVKLTADDEQVFMEYIRKVDGEKDLLVGEVLEIKDDLIVFSRVYHG